MCLCIDGALKSRRKIKYMSDDNGNPVTDKEARNHLKKLKSEGYEVMMMGDCYRFDKVKGCKGHIKSLKPCDYDGMIDTIELEWQLFKQGKRL